MSCLSVNSSDKPINPFIYPIQLNLNLVILQTDWQKGGWMEGWMHVFWRCFCRTFTAAAFSRCLSADLSAFSLVFSKWKATLLGWDFFSSMFRLIIYLLCELPSYWFCSEYKFAHFRIHPAFFVSSHFINNQRCTSSISSHAHPCYNTATTMSDRWIVMLWIMTCYSFWL